jgi:hypothetical protein
VNVELERKWKEEDVVQFEENSPGRQYYPGIRLDVLRRNGIILKWNLKT